MEQVSEAYRQELEKAVCGAAVMEVVMMAGSSQAAEDCSIHASEESYWSDAHASLAPEGAAKQSYATLEPGRWKMDGRLRVAPAPEEVLTGEGYVSEQLSDEKGLFARPPVLELGFAEQLSLPGMTFRFDAVAQEWCSQMELLLFCKDKQVGEYTLRPDAVNWEYAADLKEFDRLQLKFVKTSAPHRRVRLSRLVLGLELTLGNQELTSLKQVWQIDPIGRRLPTNQMQFSVVNHNPMTGGMEYRYDPENPKGIWKYLEQRNPVQVRFGQQILDGLSWRDMAALGWKEVQKGSWQSVYQGGFYEWMQTGYYYLTAQPTVDGLQASFEAVDLLGLMEADYYRGVADGKPVSLYQLAVAVLEDANLPRRSKDEKPWKLWEGLKEITTTAPLPVKSHRECLQLIAHAGCCVLYTSRAGDICIHPDASKRQDVKISLAQMLGEPPKLEKCSSLKQVECNVYQYQPQADAIQLHEGSYPVAGRLELHLSWQRAAEITVECSGASVVSADLYAQAGDIVLEGSGTASLTVKGKSLKESKMCHICPVEQADAQAVSETVDNPLITSVSQAEQVACWVKEYLLRRSSYTCSTRGNPEMEPLDRIGMDSIWQEDVPVQVLKNQLKYKAGALSGEMIVKKEEKEP